MPFFNTTQITPRNLVPGVYLHITWGEHIMTNLVVLDAHAEVPAHTHPEEQMGMVVEGAITMRIGNETRELTPGDIYLAPPNVEHHVVAGEEQAKVVDVFSPPREGYKS